MTPRERRIGPTTPSARHSRARGACALGQPRAECDPQRCLERWPASGRVILIACPTGRGRPRWVESACAAVRGLAARHPTWLFLFVEPAVEASIALERTLASTPNALVCAHVPSDRLPGRVDALVSAHGGLASSAAIQHWIVPHPTAESLGALESALLLSSRTP